MIKPIQMAGPWITDQEKSVVADMMENGWDNYDYVEKFEPGFAKWHDRKYALMTPCCTHAIHLMLLALGIKAGDEVIVPECTWTATAAPVTYQRAIPVFADISPENWCIAPESVIKNITTKTKAIIVVDLFGNMPDMEALISVSENTGIPLIEDAAEALGSKYKGIRAGKFGIGSVHSFHRTKTITTGEGGALLLDDDNLYERAKFLRDHGRSSKIPYFTLEATPKYMPSNLQAAVGFAQFQRIDELVKRKRYFLHRYKEKLSDIKDLQFNMETDDVYNGVWATTLVFGKSHHIKKLEAIERLAKLNVPARPFFYPLSSLPAYEPYGTGSKDKNPNAYDVSERGITLACHYSLTNEQIDFICDGIKTILGYK
jgi:perosamine synthetase